MNQVPRFSIVTPSLNQASFVGETIESVLRQAGEFEIEYFVVDGGSTDGSVPIIRNYANLLEAGRWPVQCAGIRMQWSSQPDKGQSDAVNRGLRRATGDILGWINSDDLYQPGAFARVADQFARHPRADFIYGDGDVIDEAGNLQWEWLARPYNLSVLTSYHFLWNDFTNYIMQQATFWRRPALDRIGYLDETFHYAMDAEYWIRAGHAGLKLQHIPHKLGKFRLIQGTKSRSSSTAFWEDYLEIFRRYRGSRNLAIFFAYFYYNLARQCGFDLEQTADQGSRVFQRWQALPEGERQQIAVQAARGFDLACLLTAGELAGKGLDERAATIFRRGLSHRPGLAFHPFALPYRVRSTLGPRLSTLLGSLACKLILTYRGVRYHSRYLHKAVQRMI